MHYTIYLTNECNLSCKYCYENGNFEKNRMTDEILINIIDFIVKKEADKDNNVLITLHGGEPFLEYKRINFLIDYLNEKLGNRVYYDITTNLTFLNNQILSSIIPKIHRIYVSIDGDEEHHDMNRKLSNGEGSYSLVINNLKRVLSIREDIIARMTISKNTLNNFYRNIISIYESGIKTTTFELNFEENWIYEEIDYLVLESKKIIKYFEDNGINKIKTELPHSPCDYFCIRQNLCNMLIVAVSRAKDSFIVIGDYGILDKDKNTPSGILARHLNTEDYSSITIGEHFP